MTLECESPHRFVDVQYATGEEQRHSSRKDVEAESKQKRCSVVDVSDGESKVQRYKEQYCIKLQETVKDKGAQCVAVYGVTKSWTQLGN